MTAAVQEPTEGMPRLDVSSTQQTPFGRLVSVELRKMYNTRAGFWLLLITGLLLLAAMGITLLVVALNDDIRVGVGEIIQIFTIPLSLLLPVFAITTVTAEWSQRTGLVTFALEPHRGRVLFAKLTSVLLLAVATIVVAVIFGSLTNVLAGAISGTGVSWDVAAGALTWSVVNLIAYFLMAFGLGVLMLSTPATIAVYYVFALLLPFMVYQPLYAFFGWARDVLPWIDMTFAMTPLMSENPTGMDGQALEVTGTTYAQVAVSVLIWVLVPVVLGMRRVGRAEIK